MGLYNLNNRHAGTQQAITTTYKTQVLAQAVTATLRRGRIMDLVVGPDSAPNATDCQYNFDVSRSTTLGTATSVTPPPDDPADAAAGATCVANHTVEPTVTATSSLLMIALNQRASQRWVALNEMYGLIWPATNLNGLVVRALSPTATGVVGVHAKFLDY